MAWNHDKLAEDLAVALDTPWRQVPLGSVYMDAGCQLADVITIKPSYTRFCLHIYEVKVSRSDFLGDIRRNKWRGYLPNCHRLSFAVPSGMISKDEIPAEAGLIVRGPKGWQVQKAAPKSDLEIPHNTLLSMLFMKQRGTVRGRNMNAALGLSASCGDWNGKKRQTRHLGKHIAKALRIEQEMEEAKILYERYNNQFKHLVCDGLGLEPSEVYWPLLKISSLVSEIKLKAEGGI